jgi:hypothetical protein
MPRKVKIAPDLWEVVRPFVIGERVPRPVNPGLHDRARIQYRALLAVAMAVQSWLQYDGEGWDGIVDPKEEQRLQGRMCTALRSLERLSKGDKSCPAK